MGFIRKANEVGIAVAVEQTDIAEGRSLAVGHVHNRIILGGRFHTSGQNHHIGLDFKLLAQQCVGGFDKHAVAVFGYVDHIAFCQKDTRILLHALVEVFAQARCTHMLIEDVGFAVIIVFAYILGLL